MESVLATEIERKFLVNGEGWRKQVERQLHITDHLIASFATGKARIRLCNDTATLTLKGNRQGITRSEYHVSIPLPDAEAMVAEFATMPPLRKVRNEVRFGGLVWQVDEYMGRHAGLLTADVELPAADYPLIMPEWAGSDITGDQRYSSRTLAATED
jgi:adenylate cyclase